MSTTITIPFEEVPLVREPGMVAGLVSGEAEITVHDHDDWCITAITLDGARKDHRSATLEPVAELDRASWLFTTIHSELEAHWKDQIHDAIADLVNEPA